MSLLKNDLTGHYGIRQVIFKGYQPSRECTCQGLRTEQFLSPAKSLHFSWGDHRLHRLAHNIGEARHAS